MTAPGFTPDFARTLAKMGINLGTRRASSSFISPESVIYSNADLEGQRKAIMDPKVQQLVVQLDRMRAQEAVRGGQQTAPKPGLFGRLLGYLGRPANAVMTGLLHGGRDIAPLAVSGMANPGDYARAYGKASQGFAAGLTGKEHNSGADLLALAGVTNPVGKALGGFGIDVLSDPTSYIGVGIGKSAAVDAAKITAGHAAIEQAVKRGAGIIQPATLSKALAVDVASSSKLLTPTEKAARVTSGAAEIDKAARVLGQAAHQTSVQNMMRELLEQGVHPDGVKKAAEQWASAMTVGGEQLARATERGATSALTELMHANLEQQVRRTLRVGFGGSTKVPILPIPTTAVNVLKTIGTTPLAAKALNAFDVAFHTGTRFDNALTVDKARAAGQAERRINAGRSAIVSMLEGTSSEQRKAYMKALAAAPGSFGRGVLTIGGEDAADGVEQMLAHLGSYIDFHNTGKGLLTVEDLNRYLPRPLKFAQTSLAPTLAVPRVGGATRLRDLQDAAPAEVRGGTHYGPRKVTANPAAVVREGQGSLFPDLGTAAKSPDLPALKIGTAETARPGAGQLSLLEAGAGTPAWDLAHLIARNSEHLSNHDVAHYLYAMHIAVESAVARDQLGRAIGELGVDVGAPGSAGRVLAARHGYEPLYTKGLEKEVSGFYTRHLDGKVFHPEVKAGLKRIIGIADHLENRNSIGRAYDRALTGLKRALTLPSPSYHIRNSIGDFTVSLLDGVHGPRGMASYDQAARTMASLRKVGKRPDVVEAMTAGVNPETGVAANPLQMLQDVAATRPGRAGARVMRVPRKWSDVHGDYLTSEQVWAAYNHAGLNQGFTHADLPQVMSLGRSGVPAMAKGAIDKATALSQGRENYFRLAHFIDRLKRSKASTLEGAAAEAAYYVRRFHFDYTDVTPTERAIFARVIPFYKFQRFAVPLMLQTLFANPGKILNSERALAAVSASQGYGTDPNTVLPTADFVLPQYFRDAMMLPLFQEAGHTVYMNPGIPTLQVLAQTVGLSGATPGGVVGNAAQNAVASVNPMIQAPFELAIGKRVFGGGNIPTGSLTSYLAGQTPVSNLAVNRLGTATGRDALLSYLTGLGLNANTPGKQTGAILDEEARIRANRKKSGYKAPKPSAPYSGPSGWGSGGGGWGGWGG